jgi:glutamate dehydrogenase
MNPSDPWERLLVAGLARDFQQIRLDFLRRIAACEHDLATALARWAEAHEPAIHKFRAIVGRAQAAVTVSPAMLAHISSQGRSLLAR